MVVRSVKASERERVFAFGLPPSGGEWGNHRRLAPRAAASLMTVLGACHLVDRIQLFRVSWYISPLHHSQCSMRNAPHPL